MYFIHVLRSWHLLISFLWGEKQLYVKWKQRNWYWGCQCTVNKSSRQPWGYLHKSAYFFNAKKLTWLKMLVRAMKIEPSVRIKFVSFWRHLYNIYVMISSTKIILALTFFHVAIEQKVLPNNLITVLTLWVRKANLQNWHQFLYWMLYFLACHTIQPIEKLHKVLNEQIKAGFYTVQEWEGKVKTGKKD